MGQCCSLSLLVIAVPVFLLQINCCWASVPAKDCIYLSTPMEAQGSAMTQQCATGTERVMLFPADKIKDAPVAVPRRGKQGFLGASNCLLLLLLPAYWRHFNSAVSRIVLASLVLLRLLCPALTHGHFPCIL